MDQVSIRFNGSDYLPGRDNPRLLPQYRRIFDLMKDGEWFTLGRISTITKDPEASVSAQLRHMRKERFGAHRVEKRYAGDGLFEYRLLVNEAA